MKILTVPNKILYRQAKPVEVINIKLQTLIDNMFITMYRAKGVGLAANQVDVLKQVVVMNLRYSPLVMINPHIRIKYEEVVQDLESCLSIPKYSVFVERARRIEIIFVDRYGHKRTLTADGLLARVIQHEVDHLRGRLINDGQ